MKIILIHYERNRNLGNYQTEKVGVDIELTADENPDAALNLAREFVHRQLGLKVPEPTAASTNHNDDLFLPKE